MMKHTVLGVFLLLSFSVVCYSSYAQGVRVEQTQLTQISSSLREELQNLKQSTENLQNDLEKQKIDLEEQQRLLLTANEELATSKQRLQASLTALSESNTYLAATNMKLQESSAKLIRAEHTISILRTINIVFSIILGVMFVYKIVAIVLRCRGVKLPWLLDLLF